MFNERVRRIANLRAFGKDINEIDAALGVESPEMKNDLWFLVVCADMFLDYMPFDLPERTEPTSPVSGEFTAR